MLRNENKPDLVWVLKQKLMYSPVTEMPELLRLWVL